MNFESTLALALASGWGSGLSLFGTLFILAFSHAAGGPPLPPEIAFLGEPGVMMFLGFLFMVEFSADKVPGVDSLWDGLNGFLRIPAGAWLGAAAFSGYSFGFEVLGASAAALLAMLSFALKAGGRLLINLSPEPFTNWAASFSEDVLLIVGLVTALFAPKLFLALLLLFVLMGFWLAPKMWRRLRLVGREVRQLLGGRPPDRPAPPTGPPRLPPP